MNILHIANWYPGPWSPYETPFIKAHFDALEGLIRQELWHVQVRDEDKIFLFQTGRTGERENYIVITTRVTRWLIIELLTVFLLLGLRLRLGRRWWDVVNVHVAYPLLRFPRIFRWLFGKQVVITEHWSAFHRGFNLPEGSKARRRIEHIFHHRIPVIAVSHALMEDIVKFCGRHDFTQFIVPNVVDTTRFFLVPRPEPHDAPVFLMVASWAPIKRPLLAMQAFAEVLRDYPSVRLRIVGGGAQWAAMQEFVQSHHLQESISLLGPLSKPEVAQEMQQAACFLHPSNYETFSVVCAEALCCGLPVIASNVGGITEFVNDKNGVLIDNDDASWILALHTFLSRPSIFDRMQIAGIASARFNQNVVGKQLCNVFHTLTGHG